MAQDVLADRDYPPFDKSLMDGFAVRSMDTAAAPVDLRVIGSIPAGSEAELDLSPGTCVAIMTGARVPRGADAVVPVEQARLNAETATVLQPVAPGHAIARTGHDARRGERILGAGTVVGPAQLAALASVGCTEAAVFDRPRVGIVATGDELVCASASPEGTSMRDAITPSVRSLLQALGCEVTELGIVRDDPALLEQAITSASMLDALLISGGMSMGEHDHAPRVLRSMGYSLLVEKVKIKPGKPFLVARASETGRAGPAVVFGLPGNPVSAFLCTFRLASRYLLKLAGKNVEPERAEVRLLDGVAANLDREFYQPVQLGADGARVLRWKGSADVFTLAQADAFLPRPISGPALVAGEWVRVMKVPR